jgi:hypothetical protein
VTAGRRLTAPQPLPATRLLDLGANAVGNRVRRALWHAAAAVGTVAVVGLVRLLAGDSEWRWPVDESEVGYRRLAALDPTRHVPDGRVAAHYGVALVIVFAVAVAAHLTLVACRTPDPARMAPRRLAAASALVLALPLATLTQLAPAGLGWLGRWALLADAAALAIALAAAALGARLPRWSDLARRLTLGLALGALVGVPLLHTRSYADGAPITVVAQLGAGDRRLTAMTNALSGSADVARVEVARMRADPSWAVVTVHAKAGADSADARALVRYLRRDGLPGAGGRGIGRAASRLVTGSAAGDVEAGRMRAELPWLIWSLALAAAVIGVLSRRRRVLSVVLVVRPDDVPSQRAAVSSTLVADELG